MKTIRGFGHPSNNGPFDGPVPDAAAGGEGNTAGSTAGAASAGGASAGGGRSTLGASAVSESGRPGSPDGVGAVLLGADAPSVGVESATSSAGSIGAGDGGVVSVDWVVGVAGVWGVGESGVVAGQPTISPIATARAPAAHGECRTGLLPLCRCISSVLVR